jgi:hypothetical protein
MIALNCLINPVLYFLGRIPDIGNYVKSADMVWNSTATGMVVAEIVILILALIIAIYIQARKKVFL